jgi:uncharacterized protein YjiK
MSPISVHLIFLSLLLASTSAPAVAAPSAKAKAPSIQPLQILESYTVPALEISGAAWRANPETKQRELVIIGDRDHKIYLVDWEKRKTEFAPREVDLKPLVAKDLPPDQQSEWESVFSDDSGRIFIVQESPAQILIVSADLKKLEGRIALTVPKDSKDAVDWHTDDNSGSEGLMPLSNGHVLVVKEKNPLRIFEFAQKGKAGAGYNAKLSIEMKGAFPLPKSEAIEFYPAMSWKLHPEHEELFEDASGLNADDKGALYLLGDQRNLIGRLGQKLTRQQAQIPIERLWSIPSTIKQPEGMVFDKQGRPIVAIDRKSTKHPNLFLLSELK